MTASRARPYCECTGEVDEVSIDLCKVTCKLTIKRPTTASLAAGIWRSTALADPAPRLRRRRAPGDSLCCKTLRFSIHEQPGNAATQWSMFCSCLHSPAVHVHESARRGDQGVLTARPRLANKS